MSQKISYDRGEGTVPWRAHHNRSHGAGATCGARVRRRPGGAVAHSDGYITLISGTREQLAERHYDELEYDIGC
ncbi:hypothetical protein ACWGJ2_31555 [Streptomyces sp. NPDC054796]